MLESQEGLLRELADSVASWTDAALSSPADNRHWDDPVAVERVRSAVLGAGLEREFSQAVRELLSGVIHSTLVTFDGGTALADRWQLRIQDDRGREFDRFLHELWPQFVLEEEE